MISTMSLRAIFLSASILIANACHAEKINYKLRQDFPYDPIDRICEPLTSELNGVSNHTKANNKSYATKNEISRVTVREATGNEIDKIYKMISRYTNRKYAEAHHEDPATTPPNSINIKKPIGAKVLISKSFQAEGKELMIVIEELKNPNNGASRTLFTVDSERMEIIDDYYGIQDLMEYRSNKEEGRYFTYHGDNVSDSEWVNGRHSIFVGKILPTGKLIRVCAIAY